MERQIKNIIFDVDGTLSFTEPGVVHCIKDALGTMGIEIPPDALLRKCIGPPLTDSFVHRLSVPKERLDEAMKLFRAEYEKTGLYECEPYEGLDETLKGLKDEGYNLYVASSKAEQSCVAILTHFGFDKYFTDICGANLEHKIERKIEVLEELFRRNPDLLKKESYLVGDTFYDAEGATAFGIDCLGVLYGFGDKKSLIEYGCRAVVEKPEDIKKYFDGLSW